MKITLKIDQNSIFFFLFFLFAVIIANGQDIFDVIQNTFTGLESLQSEEAALSLADIKLNKGEAFIWYLSHAGWAVKTSSALMIFDYWEQMQKPEKPSLLSGFIDPNEIKEQNVYVFVSHGHGDHYDEKILEWGKKIPNISYIFGWKEQNAGGEFHYFGKERVTKQLGPLKISNIYHDFDNIPESAFLVEVDGLTIYFSGDHGNSPGKLNPVYKDNIDYMAGQSDNFDLIFLSVFGSPSFDGEFYAIEKFKPQVMLPMHYGGREELAESFITLAKSKFPGAEFWFPLNNGDSFLFK